MSTLPPLSEVRQRIFDATYNGPVRVDELALESGVCENTIYGIRSGKHKDPRYSTIVKLLTTLERLRSGQP